jgi:hypothetical protein
LYPVPGYRGDMDWGTISGVVSALLGVGLTMAANTPNEFRFIRTCFWASAVLISGFHLFSQWSSGQPLWLKVASASLVAAVTFGTLTVALDWANRKQTAQVPQSLPAPKAAPALSLEQALVVFDGVFTEQKYDPLRLRIFVKNAGKLPTVKAFFSMDHAITETPMTGEMIDRQFAERAAGQVHLLDLTLVPGQQAFSISMWSAGVTKAAYAEIATGKKFLYIFLAGDYVDGSTPEGKRMITELAVRAVPNVRDPMRSWSLVRHHSYLYGGTNEPTN